MNIRFWESLKSSRFQLLQASFTTQVQLLQNDIATIHHGINACLLQTWNPRCNFYKEGIPTTNHTAPKCYKMGFGFNIPIKNQKKLLLQNDNWIWPKRSLLQNGNRPQSKNLQLTKNSRLYLSQVHPFCSGNSNGDIKSISCVTHLKRLACGWFPLTIPNHPGMRCSYRHKRSIMTCQLLLPILPRYKS